MTKHTSVTSKLGLISPSIVLSLMTMLASCAQDDHGSNRSNRSSGSNASVNDELTTAYENGTFDLVAKKRGRSQAFIDAINACAKSKPFTSCLKIELDKGDNTATNSPAPSPSVTPNVDGSVSPPPSNSSDLAIHYSQPVSYPAGDPSCLRGPSYTYTFLEGGNGRLKSMVVYDQLGAAGTAPAHCSAAKTYIYTWTNGRLAKVTMGSNGGSGVSIDYTYDADGYVTSITTSASSTTLSGETYAYENSHRKFTRTVGLKTDVVDFDAKTIYSRFGTFNSDGSMQSTTKTCFALAPRRYPSETDGVMPECLGLVKYEDNTATKQVTTQTCKQNGGIVACDGQAHTEQFAHINDAMDFSVPYALHPLAIENFGSTAGKTISKYVASAVTLDSKNLVAKRVFSIQCTPISIFEFSMKESQTSFPGSWKLICTNGNHAANFTRDPAGKILDMHLSGSVGPFAINYVSP